MNQSLIAAYQRFIDVKPEFIVSLGEGHTPLVSVGKSFSLHGIDLHFKFEGANPTGSFKDRGMTVAISHALSQGAKAVICASTGNTSAAAAAYAARAGMECFVLIPEGKIALGKLAQAMVHGASVIQIEGNFDEGMQMVKALAEQLPITLVNSVNPYRLQGQKTAAFEIVDVLGKAPDYHYLPVGNAGNISAYWMGYQEYHQHGLLSKLPVMVGAQAQGANPFIKGEPIAHPDTIATAIRIGNPQSWQLAMQAQIDSQGWFVEVTDQEILEAQRAIAQLGIFCEPASAASFAALIKDCYDGRLLKGSQVVCTLTGHGLKDPNVVLDQYGGQLTTVPSSLEQIKAILKEKLAA